MRTPREDAIARLKAVGDKMQAGNLAPDAVNALFKEFTEGVMSALAKPEATGRKMSFGGDIQNQKAGSFGSLPPAVQKGLDESMILGTLLRRPASSTKHFKDLFANSPELQEYKKAMDSTTAGEGDEWVPTGLSPELVAEVTQMGMIEGMHPHIPMPTQPYEIPIQTGRLESFKASENTGSTGQTAITKSSVVGLTNKLTLTAIDLGVEVLVSKHLQEDSIVGILPFLRNEIVAALKRGVEEGCINGDTTGTHQDTDVSVANDRRRIWAGFRKLALENSYSVDFAGAGNSFDFETWMKVRAKHGKYGINPSDLYWLVGLELFFKSLSLKDANGNAIVTTIDKLGSRATALTGVLGVLAGSEIAVSEFSKGDLNASGVNGAVSADNIKSSILSVQKSGFVFGDRRDARIQLLSEKYAEEQQDALLSVIRKDFKALRPIASNAAVAIGYNIA